MFWIAAETPCKAATYPNSFRRFTLFDIFDTTSLSLSVRARVELKTPRPEWPDLYKEAFEGHPDADSYLFITKGEHPVYERKGDDEFLLRPYDRIPVNVTLVGEDWWLIGVGIDPPDYSQLR